jgi:outer membrane protein OmpA-like peptidoglycan-associated protein
MVKRVREDRERHPRLPVLPLLDFCLLVVAIGTAELTAEQHQRAALHTVVEREIASQRTFWSKRASELCVPPAETPAPARTRAIVDVTSALTALRAFRDDIWASYRDCVDERVEVIPEQLLRFAFDRSDAFDMTPNAVEEAQSRIRALVDDNRDRRRIFVRGHTDWKGTDEYNYALSADRAWYVGRVVLAHLTSQGLIAGRDFELIPEGLGESRPVEPNANESPEVHESRCRRIEIAFQRVRAEVRP